MSRGVGFSFGVHFAGPTQYETQFWKFFGGEGYHFWDNFLILIFCALSIWKSY